MKQKIEKRSPLKDKPLRYPGQSLDEEIERLVYDEFMIYAVISIYAVGVVVFEWWRWYTDSPPKPIPFTILAVIILGFTLVKYWKIKQRIQNLKLGRDGEKIVGQSLEELRREGYHIFHDIKGDRFNLDHVVISPRGIFVIETKTYSKPTKGNAKIRFDGTRILVDGLEPERNPVDQAHALRRWLQEILLKSTGKNYPVWAVIVFPGWFVETISKPSSDTVWVLNPKGLPSYISHKSPVLPPEDVQLAVFHLSRYIQVTY